MITCRQFVLKFIPHRGVATIFHKTFHIRGQFLARCHHCGGSAHRYSGYYNIGVVAKNVYSHIYPSSNIIFVAPTHLNVSAIALAMAVQVGQKYVVAKIVMKHITDVHHSYAVRFISMNDNGCFVARIRCRRISGK